MSNSNNSIGYTVNKDFFLPNFFNEPHSLFSYSLAKRQVLFKEIIYKVVQYLCEENLFGYLQRNTFKHHFS